MILFDHIHNSLEILACDRREKAEQMVKESEQKKKETIQATEGSKTKGLNQ